MASTGIERYDKITNRIPSKELATLLKVTSSLASTMDLEQVLQIAIESAVDLLNFNTGAIYTLKNDILTLGATTPPLPPDFPDELRSASVIDHPHIQKAIMNHGAVFLEDARVEPLSPAEKVIADTRQLKSILYFPLLLKENTIGVFIVGTTRKTRQFTNSEIDLCYIFSFQVAFAVANALLFQEAHLATVDLVHAYEATLEGWSKMLDLRDHITDAHTHRVADLTLLLANKIGIPESQMGAIRRGALLHDIGKMGIPDSILQKPSVLSDNEREIMQTHPENAFHVLSQIEYLSSALEIPFCHHEKWDGTGYPRHLKGEEIPLSARLFSVVDVYDALTSDRPYRKAWSKTQAIEYIQNESGKFFWPEAVKAFLEVIQE